MNDKHFDVIMALCGTIVTSILVPLVTSWLNNMNLRQQDKRLDLIIKARAADIQESVKDDARTTAAILAVKTQMATDKIANDIKQNTEMTTKAANTAARAFEVGNDINRKIANNQAAIKELHEKYGKGEQMDRMEQTDKDTNATVHEIKEETKP